MVEIPRPFEKPQDRLKIRHAGERRHPGYGQCPSYRWKTVSRLIKRMGMDPGFHRGDDKAAMTGTSVDFQSTNAEPLGLEPRVVH
jgi:hypothetical protein